MKYFTFFLILLPSFLISQNVGIGTTTPAASATLEIQSTDGGVLIPRLTTTQRDDVLSPATGLLIYNSVNRRFEFYNGSEWAPIASESLGGFQISDLDDDTKVTTGNFIDDDKVRITAGGNETIEVDSKTVHIKTATKATYIGELAGAFNIANTDNWNTHLGYKSGEKGTNGGQNTLIGAFAGANKANLGDENVMVGLSAGFDNEGDNNTFIGRDAGRFSAGGSDNTFIGHDAGRNSTGSANVFLGRQAGENEVGSNKLYIENSNSTSPLIYGDFENDSIVVNGTLSINRSYELPNVDGAPQQVMTTDGSGNLQWADGGGGAFEDVNGQVRQKSGYDQDFIVGRDAMPVNGETVDDYFFFYDKSKAAFRGGRLQNSKNWSPDSLQDHSFGFGYNVQPRGIASTALGNNTAAIGNYSTALGSETMASGLYALAFGNLTTAEGFSSVALGAGTISSGDYSFSMGRQATASGTFSNAFGDKTSSSGRYSNAFGKETTSAGWYSTAFGDESTAFSYGEMAIGSFNSMYTPSSILTWNANDRLFVIGNGTSDGDRSDAMVVLKNGDVSLPDGNLLVGRDQSPINGEMVSDTFFFFDKSRAAFRGGSLMSSSDWAPDSIGVHSFAFGLNSKATGSASFCFGENSEANGPYSLTIGSDAKANSFSTAIGFSSDAVNSSTALGGNSFASGFASLALGTSSNSKGDYSTAIGYASESEGDYSVALGSSVSLGSYSVSGGSASSSVGFGSTAFGVASVAESFGETAIGTWNTDYTPNDVENWNSDDRIFVIGNGSSPFARSDAMVVLKNGDTGIGTSYPTKPLHVVGDMLIESESNANIIMNTTGITDGRILTREVSTNDVFVGDIDDNGGDLIFRAAGENKMVIGDSGNAALYDGDFYSLTSSNNLGRPSNKWNFLYLNGGTVTGSDRRLKTKIKTLGYGLYDIMKMKPVSYELKSDLGDVKLGLIAQEVDELVPEIVHKPADPAEHLGVSYVELVPILIKGMQEQQEIIDELQNVNSTILKKLALLESQISNEVRSTSVSNR